MGKLNSKTNLNRLINSKYKIVGPDIGEMACGEYGSGKFSDPVEISNIINDYFKNGKIKSLKH